ncbi:hypothetical protein CVT24_004227 [Panaeolus cyanescens]|uniref:Inhibitor I9 domain-containing protein n=1 Tax=Panaeolus cyanescens TaxID=181874 RepID=A0A409YSW9_9AGAR|nr:hypothetical protein CVT24_004227 [Panaeolus cyanescens]
MDTSSTSNTSPVLTINKAENPTGEHIIAVKEDANLDDVIKLAKDPKSVTRLEIIHAFCGTFDKETLDKFLSHPDVRRVSEDGFMDD